MVSRLLIVEVMLVACSVPSDALPDGELVDASRDDTGVDGGVPDGSTPVDARDATLDASLDARADAGPDAIDAGFFVSECLGRSGPRVDVRGEQRAQFRPSAIADGTVFDATTAFWPGTDDAGDPIPWVVTFRDRGTGSDSCWFGGDISGPWDEDDPDVTWEDPFHHAGGMTIDIADLLVESVRITNQGDGIRPYAPNVTIRRAWLRDIHDDCIENDDFHSLLVEDSLLDGCYVGFSARGFTDDAPDGSDELWTIRDTLIRLELQPTVFRGPAPGHGPFFKWDREGRAPRLAVHDSVFRADQAPNHGALGIPAEVELESCSGNVMVWLGEGEFPAELPDCFEVTTDRSRWDDEVEAWHARTP